ILPERLEHLAGGERLVLRPLTRMNKWGWAVVSHPIFNTGKTLMPFAHTFLTNDFNPKTNPDLVEKIDAHANINLKALEIDWSKWLTWTEQVTKQDEDGNVFVEEENLALQAYNQYRQSDANVQAAAKDAKEEQEMKKSLKEEENQIPPFITNWLTEHDGDISDGTKQAILNEATKLKDVPEGQKPSSIAFVNIIYKDKKLEDKNKEKNELTQEFSQSFNEYYQDK
ncbi:MAG: conjugal transfer protein TraG, partial [Lactobacillus crispatus]|nr:conjugal transfer protein TraG [Lactobacillus crispatus]